MGTIGVHRYILSWCCFLTISFSIANFARSDEDPPKSFPEGFEKAVAAVREALPNAGIDATAEPEGFGGSGGTGTPLCWIVRFHTGEKKQELTVNPEGA